MINKIAKEEIKKGTVVVLCNRKHKLKKPCAVGSGLRTKVNANIGTSAEKISIKDELKKLDAAQKAGADAVMDLSTGGDIVKVRQEIISHSTVPVGTVPIYEIAINAKKRSRNKDFLSFTAEDIFEVLERQAREGVDFFTIHAGVTRKSILALKKHPRLMGIVSRGGAILASWMLRNKKENPFYEYFDKVLHIAKDYDITISLGDGLRPGAIADSTDKPQLTELKILGELVDQARKAGVQVMVEGPGHIPLPQIEKNIALEKKWCKGAPFYVLGPLVTDIASGYDHISCAIGGALAAWKGADFLCYVTASEHLRLPDYKDVYEGVIACRIAAHAADIAKNVPGARQWDNKMSHARRLRDWKTQISLSIDPEKAARYHGLKHAKAGDICTMCGEFCSIKINEECFAGSQQAVPAMRV